MVLNFWRDIVNRWQHILPETRAFVYMLKRTWAFPGIQEDILLSLISEQQHVSRQSVMKSPPQAMAGRQAMQFLQSNVVLVRSVNWSPNGKVNLSQSSTLS